MEKVSLSDIARVTNAVCSDELQGIKVDAVCTDTRAIQPGCLFVAIEGERFDAHDFAEQAAQNGAVALVCRKKVKCRVPVLYVEDTRTAFLDIAGWYRSLFSIPLIGITGSVGKTTTKEFIALAMSVKYKTLKTQGNLNNDIGMPTTLLRLDNSYEAAVIEMGMNHFGEIHALSTRCKPTMGVITNIGVSHIENLGSREGILKAKLEILDGMDAKAPLLLNADNDLLSQLRLPRENVYYFGIDNEQADFRATDISAQENSTSFFIHYGGKMQRVSIPVSGMHNVLNAVCAFAVGVLNDIEPQAVAAALAEYVPAGMRQRLVQCGSFDVIEDCYNASPDSMRASIEMLAQRKAGKKIAVLADMLELGTYAQIMHEQIGAFAAERGIDVLLGYGELAAHYCTQAELKGIKKAEHFLTKQDLLEALLKEIEEGSAVLFKGSHGMHLEQTIRDLYERKGIKNE